MKCGEPYSPQHQCPKQIPLHVLEELLEVMEINDSEDEASDTGDQGNDEKILAISYFAAEGIQGKKTMRLQGLI